MTKYPKSYQMNCKGGNKGVIKGSVLGIETNPFAWFVYWDAKPTVKTVGYYRTPLRGLGILRVKPAVKTAGYFHPSPRDCRVLPEMGSNGVSPADFEKLNLCFIRVHLWLKLFLA
jgi:hypothetical protein